MIHKNEKKNCKKKKSRFGRKILREEDKRKKKKEREREIERDSDRH